MIWGDGRNNRISKDFRAEDRVANRWIKDESYLSDAVCQSLDGLVSAARNDIEQNIRVLLVIVAQNRSNEAVDRGLESINVDCSRLEILQSRNMRLRAREFAHHATRLLKVEHAFWVVLG